MSKLTTERLEKKIKSCIEIENCEVMMPLSAAQELLAFRNSAKNPVELFAAPVLLKQHEHSRQHFESLCNQFWNWAEFDEINHDEEPRLEWNGSNYTHRVTAALWKMYQAAPAQPVIPEQPHRISDDDLVAVPRSVLACAGYAYGKAGLKGGFAYEELRTYFFAPTITAQPVMPEQPEPTISFYRDGIIAAAKWVENQRDAYDNEHGQSDPDTGAFEFGNDAQLEYSTTLSEIAEGIRSLHPASAQPVSEPYKLPAGYFSYGTEHGFNWHQTAKQATDDAEAMIDDYRGDACDGWSEETDNVCWGVILQQAGKVDERPRTDDDANINPHIDTVCDYALLPAQESE